MFRKIAALLVAGLIGAGVARASEGGLEPADIRLDDVAPMQRGARLPAPVLLAHAVAGAP